MRFRLLTVFLLILILPTVAWCSGLQITVETNGITPNLSALILSGLSIKAAENEPKLTKDRIQILNQIAPEEITRNLEALGYYRSKIQSTLIPTSNGYIARYTIQLGPATLIRSVVVKLCGEGRDKNSLLSIANHPSLTQGMQLKHQVYEEYKQELLGKALQLGYLDAAFTVNEIRISQNKAYADIILELDTDHQYFFGEVIFGAGIYPSCYLQRYVPFKIGAPYTTEQLLQLQKALTESDLFNRIRIYPEVEEATDYHVPLKVKLKARPLNNYTAGVGYGTDTGYRGNVGWEHRLTSLPGHKMNANIRVSQKRNRANLLYTIPGLNPTTDRMVLGIEGIEERFDDKFRKSLDSSITQIQKIEQWERILSLHYLAEIFREMPDDPKRNTRFLLPTVSYIWTDLIKTTPFHHGTRIGVTTRGSLGALVSSTNLLQVEIQPKWIVLLGESARLILRGDFGGTLASNHNDIPLSLRFFTGGDMSVRGYGYKTLGPKELDRAGKRVVIGGRYMVVGSAEVEKLIYKSWSGALFVDAGNAMNRWNKHLAVGAGIGVRWATPLGPFRLDIAQALKSGKVIPRIHITFGMDL